MIKHIVCWNLKEKTEENAAAVKEALEALAGQIPGLLKIEVGVDFNGSEMARDICLYSELESREALDSYQSHPLHQAAANDVVRPRTCDRVVVDYEV
ncbi:MAG: Dabb family protein [Planctomycetota bacterium]|jgi:hypothetical protein